MVNPLLNGALHTNLLTPIHIVGCCFIIRRLLHKGINFLLSVSLFRIDIVHFHPSKELWMIDNIFFEGIACLINKINMYIRIVWIHLATTLINWHKDWFNTRSCLSHQTGSSRRSNRQTSNVTTSILSHFFIESRIHTLDTIDKWIVLLSLSIIDGKCTTLLCHLN